MKKLHNNVVNVALTRNELWALMTHLDGRKDVFVPVELFQKIVTGYHDAIAIDEKQNKAAAHIERPIDISDALTASEDFPGEEQSIDAAWILYLEAIKNSADVRHYEPIPYLKFCEILQDYLKTREARVKHVPGTPDVLEVPLEDIENCLTELLELQATYQSSESDAKFTPNNRENVLKALTLAQKSVQMHLNKAQDDESLSVLVDLERPAHEVFYDVITKLNSLQMTLEQDLKGSASANMTKAPVGPTLLEGSLSGVKKAVRVVLDLEEKYQPK